MPQKNYVAPFNPPPQPPIRFLPFSFARTTIAHNERACFRNIMTDKQMTILWRMHPRIEPTIIDSQTQTIEAPQTAVMTLIALHDFHLASSAMF